MQQNWPESLRDLDHAISIQKTPQVLSMRGRVHTCMRQWKLAVRDYDDALQVEPHNEAIAKAKAEALMPHIPLPMLGEEEATRISIGK